MDSSSLIAFLGGAQGRDVDLVEDCLAQRIVVLPPVVLAELTSDPKLDRETSELLRELPLLPVGEGYWERVGVLRSKLIGRRLRAHMADTLIAQSCIDNQVPLIARDGDFRHLARWGGLDLIE